MFKHKTVFECLLLTEHLCQHVYTYVCTCIYLDIESLMFIFFILLLFFSYKGIMKTVQQHDKIIVSQLSDKQLSLIVLSVCPRMYYLGDNFQAPRVAVSSPRHVLYCREHTFKLRLLSSRRKGEREMSCVETQVCLCW